MLKSELWPVAEVDRLILSVSLISRYLEQFQCPITVY